MNNTDVPIWEKYTLTVEEASKYFRIGEKKLRKLAEENLDAGWVIVNGNRIQIKRKQFEKIIDTLDEIFRLFAGSLHYANCDFYCLFVLH